MNLDTYKAYEARRVAAWITYTNTFLGSATPGDRDAARIALARATKAVNDVVAWGAYIGPAR